MAYTNIVKTAPISVRNWAIEKRPLPDGSFEYVEHVFLSLKSACMIDIMPQKGFARVVFAQHSGNAYPSFIYAWKPNKFYFWQGGETEEMWEYDPVTGETIAINQMSCMSYYENSFRDNSGNRTSSAYETRISTDGYCSFSTTTHRHWPAVARYNGTTGQFDICNKDPFKEFDIIHGRPYTNAFKVDTPSSPFNGIYSYWYDDSFNSVLDTAIAEGAAASPVVTFGGTRTGYLHFSDRAASSTTRRVLAPVNIAGVDSAGVYLWRIIDVKSPSTWYKNSTNLDGEQGIGGNFTEDAWEDQATASVSTTNWSYGELQDYNTDTGLTNPSYDPSLFPPILNQVGRFIYVHHYNTAKTNFYCIPYAMDDYPSLNIVKGQVIYPKNWPVWNYATQMLNNSSSLAIYLCNFGGSFGFSSNNEYVGFFNNIDASLQSTGQKGFLRPDNLEFMEYDPVTDPSGYVVASVDVQNPTDPNGFGVTSNYWGNEILQIINEEDWYTGHNNYFKSAIRDEFKIRVDSANQSARLVFDVVPDYTKPHQIGQVSVDLVPTLFGTLAGVLEMTQDQLLVGGLIYAGIVAMDRDDMLDTLSEVHYFSDVISFRGCTALSTTKAIFWGYLNTSNVITTTNWPNLSSVNHSKPFNGEINKVLGVEVLNANYAVMHGTQVRTAAYRNSYAYLDYYDIATDTMTPLPNRPKDLDPESGLDFRNKISLTQSSADDATTENAVLAYLAANPSVSRPDLITDFLGTTIWGATWVSTYGGSKIVVSLSNKGLSALRGITIYEFPGFTGTTYTEDYYDATTWSSCLFIDKADPSTITSGDYKLISLQVVDKPDPGNTLLGLSNIGKVKCTTNYTAFFRNDPTNSRSIIYILTNAALESAASTTKTITSFNSVVTMPTLSTSSTYGVGEGGKGFLSGDNRPIDWAVTSGDFVYFVVNINQDLGGGTFEAVKRIDLSTGTIIDWCTAPFQGAKGIHYNSTTDTAYVVNGTSAYRVPNFTTLTPPFSLS